MTFAGGAGALLDPGAAFTGDDEDAITPDGTAELRDVAVGNFLTECPQAGLRAKGDTAQPLDRRQVDAVEKISNQSGNIRANQDYTCMPQDETSLDVNPTNSSNIVGGANDYRLGTGSSGFYATTDGGKHWYDGIIPFPSPVRRAAVRASSFRRRPGDLVRPVGRRVLRAARVLPRQRHGRRLRLPLDERRLHVEPRADRRRERAGHRRAAADTRPPAAG